MKSETLSLKTNINQLDFLRRTIYFSSLKNHFFYTFCVFLYIIMYILNFTRPIKNMSVIEIRDFVFENYYKRIGFSKENSHYPKKRLKKKDLLLLANKLIEKNTWSL